MGASILQSRAQGRACCRAVSAWAAAMGKTAFVAALATAALDGPLAFRGSEVGLVASSKEQARISYRHVVRYLGAKVHDKKRWRCCESQNDVLIENRKQDIVLQVKAAEPRALHGMAPKLLLLDEPAQWMPTKVDAMFAALRTSLGKQPDSLLLALGTRAAEPGHPFSRLLESCDFRSTYCAGAKANPPSLQDMVIRQSELAHYAGSGGGHKSGEPRCAERPELDAFFSRSALEPRSL